MATPSRLPNPATNVGARAITVAGTTAPELLVLVGIVVEVMLVVTAALELLMLAVGIAPELMTVL